MNTRTPRRNSYATLIEDNHWLVMSIAERWNMIILFEDRKPNMEERLEMADKLRMNDASFYSLRKANPEVFAPLPDHLKRQFQPTRKAETALTQPATKGHKTARTAPLYGRARSLSPDKTR